MRSNNNYTPYPLICKNEGGAYNRNAMEKKKMKMGKTRNAARSRSRIYLDYASATPVDPRVLKAMAPYWDIISGNPGALHEEGVSAKQALTDARSRVAHLLHARASEMIFTGSGTEANNLAIMGTVAALERRGVLLESMHLIVSAIEHESVLAPAGELERRGVKVTLVSPEPSGIVSAEKIMSEMRPETVLVSLQAANHEIGTIQPVPELGRKVKAWRTLHKADLPYFHSDASQAALLLNVSVDRLSVDLMTLDAQKIYGPKGVGALYKRQGAVLSPVLFGGRQEQGLRPATENIPAIVGMAAALSLAFQGICALAETSGTVPPFFRGEGSERFGEWRPAQTSAEQRQCFASRPGWGIARPCS